MQKPRVTCLAIFSVLVFGLISVCSFAQSVNVTTWQNDNGRTGQNTSEGTLTLGNVNKTSFGKICSYTLLPNEQVYAQPLVLANIMIGGTLHEAVYVVTMQDNIYVFDGASHNGNNCILLQGPFPLIPSNEAPVGLPPRQRRHSARITGYPATYSPRFLASLPLP